MSGRKRNPDPGSIGCPIWPFANATSQVERKSKDVYGNPTTQESPPKAASALHLAHLFWLGFASWWWWPSWWCLASTSIPGPPALSGGGSCSVMVTYVHWSFHPQPASSQDPDAVGAHHAELQVRQPHTPGEQVNGTDDGTSVEFCRTALTAPGGCARPSTAAGGDQSPRTSSVMPRWTRC